MMKEKIKYCILFAVLTQFSFANKTQCDSLRNSIKYTIQKLDSISKDSIVNLNSKSLKFILFKKMYQEANDCEMKYLIKYHSNPVVRGYAYIGLILKNDSNGTLSFKKRFVATGIQYGDEIGICYKSQVFINNIEKKKLRIKSKVDGNNFSVESNEQKVLFDEKKIKKEQGIK